MKVKIGTRTFESCGASCSCCGASPKKSEDRGGYGDWLVYRASLADSDGVYYSYLCGDSTGDGCLSEIADEQESSEPVLDERWGLERQEMADICREMMGDDEDGCWSHMEDF